MSKIEWTGETWNPIIGCDKVSAGCKNCYAIQTAWIRQHNPKMKEKYAGVVEKTENGKLNWTGKINMHEPSLLKPLHNKKPTVYFVNSMSDLFHESIPFIFINAVFSVMSDVDRHTYQVLTKRPARMVEFFKWKQEEFGIPWQPSGNVWLGVSVEDQKAADERIPLLLQVPAAVRFLSCEPLLAPVDFKKHNLPHKIRTYQNAIHWVIAGGESGPGARPMHPDWARNIRDQCKAAKVSFFFKQWGEYLPECQIENVLPDLLTVNAMVKFQSPYNLDKMNSYYKVGKKKAGRLLDGQLHDEFPKTLTHE